MTMSRTVFWAAGAGLALSIAGLTAWAGPMEDRQAAMKQVAQSMKEASAFTSAQTPFDAAKAKASMGQISDAARKLKGLYPAGSGTDPKSAADPKVWENKADFDKRLAEMGTLAAAAGKSADQAAFKTAFGEVGASCKSCHDIYRKKKTS